MIVALGCRRIVACAALPVLEPAAGRVGDGERIALGAIAALSSLRGSNPAPGWSAGRKRRTDRRRSLGVSRDSPQDRRREDRTKSKNRTQNSPRWDEVALLIPLTARVVRQPRRA